LEKICKNFHTLLTAADQFPYTPNIIREERELLSQAHLEKINDSFPLKMNNSYDYDKNEMSSNRKPKQMKKKWSQEEQNLFIQGLDLYGAKSNIF
jgi:hypothetical protein